MLIPVILAFLAAVAFSRSFCIEEVENSTADPYITYSLQRTVEKAFLENGYELSCEGNPHKVRIRISSFEETPIAYTPAQRVSSYNLILRAEVRINGKSISIGGAVRFRMLISVESSRSVEEVRERLEERSKERGFGVLGVHEVSQILQNKGHPIDYSCVIVEICQPASA